MAKVRPDRSMHAERPGTKWVKRERPKIDRVACPWLVARFIDPQAEFLYLPAQDVLRVAKETGATPYDIPDVELSHTGELCSFDAFMGKYGLHDPALQQLALIQNKLSRSANGKRMGSKSAALWVPLWRGQTRVWSGFGWKLRLTAH